MKRLYFALLATLSILAATAQTQNGVVKTRGRMIDGKHVPGKGLPGTVISIKERTDVGIRNSNGSFSFPAKGKQFTVLSVSKKDYALVDADAAPKTYQHTADTVYFLMETPDRITNPLDFL